ncbi:MAG: hypothetical protein K6G22_09665 [Lachnospiraceae bacterium]|nr:hypothetical protein [Lachnospiraceae bacterium]
MGTKMAIGVTAGLVIGLVIAFALIKVANTNRRMKTEYDERQQKIRGKSYMYGFYTILFYQVAVMILDIAEISLPIEKYALDFTGILLGCIVLCAHSVWNGVYWGLNNDRKRYYIIFAVAAVLNLLPIVGQAVSGTLLQNGKIGLVMLNIMVIIMMAVIVIEMVIKNMIDKKKAEEDE